VNSAEPKAAGERSDKRDDDCDGDGHNDQERGACEQNGRHGLQDRVDHSDDCLEKNHLR
jgi:hypothetical protein